MAGCGAEQAVPIVRQPLDREVDEVAAAKNGVESA
jgi:hypothetical protein